MGGPRTTTASGQTTTPSPTSKPAAACLVGHGWRWELLALAVFGVLLAAIWLRQDPEKPEVVQDVSELAVGIDSLNGEVATLNDRLAAALANAENAPDVLSQVRSRMQGLSGRLGGLSARLGTVRARVSGRESARLGQLQAQLETKRSQVQIAEGRALVEQGKSELQAQLEQRPRARTAQAQIDALAAASEAQRAAIQAQIGALRAQLEAQRAAIAGSDRRDPDCRSTADPTADRGDSRPPRGGSPRPGRRLPRTSRPPDQAQVLVDGPHDEGRHNADPPSTREWRWKGAWDLNPRLLRCERSARPNAATCGFRRCGPLKSSQFLCWLMLRKFPAFPMVSRPWPRPDEWRATLAHGTESQCS